MICVLRFISELFIVENVLVVLLYMFCVIVLVLEMVLIWKFGVVYVLVVGL